MNKFSVLLITVIIVLLGIMAYIELSDGKANSDRNQNIENSKKIDKDNSEPLDPYYKLIEENQNYKIYTDKSGLNYFYNVYDNSGECIDRGFHIREIRFEITDEILSVRMGFGTYSFKCRYYNSNTSQISRFYDNPLEISGNYITYFKSKNDEDIVLIVQDIFDKTVYYKEFERNFSPVVLNVYSETEFINNNKQLKISYPINQSNEIITEIIDL